MGQCVVLGGRFLFPKHFIIIPLFWRRFGGILVWPFLLFPYRCPPGKEPSEIYNSTAKT